MNQFACVKLLLGGEESHDENNILLKDQHAQTFNEWLGSRYNINT